MTHADTIDFRSLHIAWDQNGVSDFFWPENRLNGKIVYDALLMAYINFARKNNSEYPQTINNLNIIILNFLSLANSILFAEKLSAYLKKNNRTPIFPENHLLWHASYDEDYKKIPFLFTGNFEKGAGIQIPAWKKLLRTYKDFIKPFSGFRRSNLKIFSPMHHIACTSLCSIATAYRKKIDEDVHLIPIEEWFYAPTEKEIQYLDQTHLPAILDEYLDQIVVIAKNFDMPLGLNAQEYFRDWMTYNLSYVALYRRRFEEKKIPIPQRLWVGSLGNVFNRFLAQLVIEKNGYVQVHDHGEGGNFSRDLIVPFREFGMTSKFVTYYQYQADFYKSVCMDASININRVPQIESLHQKDPLFDSSNTRPPLKKIKTILYPCPLINLDVRGWIPLASAMEIIDWQTRLFRHINQMGIKIWFKPHPLTFHPFPDYSKFFELEEKKEPFEEIMNEADAILFDWSLTTTFGNAFKTSKPIIFLDFDLATFSQQDLDLLNQRCTIIPGTFDDRHRMNVDWEKFSACLNAPL